MKIENVEQLTDAYPEFVAEIKAMTEKGYNKNDRRLSLHETDVKARNGFFELLAAVFGQNNSDRIKTIAQLNLSLDQIKAISDNMTKNLNLKENKRVQAAKQTMMELIKNMGAENPGTDGGSSTTSDFMVLVNQYQETKKLTKAGAIMAVMKEHPKAHRAYIKNANKYSRS